MKRVSPKPEFFADERERYCWQVAQDIAFRAGMALLQRHDAAWIVSDTEERCICKPSRSENIWFETLRVLKMEFPGLCRVWLGGRSITKPGEIP